MIKNYTNSLYTNLYLNAARELDLKFAVIDKKEHVVTIFDDKKEFFIRGCGTQFNNTIGRFFAKNKNHTLKRLEKFDIPTPKFRKFRIKEDAFEYAINCKYNIVVKPSDDSCANGVTVKPQGEEQIKDAIDEAFSFQSEGAYIMIEEFIEGKDYRITVFNKEIIAITYRAPGYVTGNGTNTIEELIEIKNKKKDSDGEPLISLRKKDFNHLENEGITLDYIPKKNELVKLQLGCDREIGGERHRIDINSVPQVNKELFTRIPNLLKLKYAGIDFIIPDITKDYKKQICGVNEVNSAPHQDVHYYDTKPGDNYSCKRILSLFFNL